MKRYQFFLRILPEDYLDYYRGVARHVVVHATPRRTDRPPSTKGNMPGRRAARQNAHSCSGYPVRPTGEGAG